MAPGARAPRRGLDFKIWERPGWRGAIERVLQDDEAIERSGGTPYNFIERLVVG